MADPALTVADLEALRSSDRLQISEAHTDSTKDVGTASYLHSILKKPKLSEAKKVGFIEPDKSQVHEIKKEENKTSDSGSDELKELSEGLQTIESQGTESLKTLSMLNSEGLLKSTASQIQSANDLRWKANSISTKHLPKKHYGQSACEVFRQRLNNHYMKSIQRNLEFNDLNIKKPETPVHMVVASDRVMLVRSYNKS
ncbi:hypothetical protein SteCoe_12457 [Stentor coeruleus]|uniref:Uncharacterized protein n=1 Tax=Stentor coeruleus TaxID=5963 RepID=A0A1R2CAW0_9CILI|nr:hypothetical protein SteCoe_12457 [Stentor coeruleus]